MSYVVRSRINSGVAINSMLRRDTQMDTIRPFCRLCDMMRETKMKITIRPLNISKFGFHTSRLHLTLHTHFTFFAIIIKYTQTRIK